LPLKRLLGTLTCHPLKAHLWCAVGQQGAEAKLERVCESATIWWRVPRRDETVRSKGLQEELVADKAYNRRSLRR
jgi:hypothetical protein